MSAETHTQTNPPATVGRGCCFMCGAPIAADDSCECFPPTNASHLSPFARQMAERCPELWEQFVTACRREDVAASGITPADFIRRCTRATRRLIRETRQRFVNRRRAA